MRTKRAARRRWYGPHGPVAASVALLLCLGSCDPPVSYVVTRRAVVGAGCPDATRDFVITRKLSCCPDRAPRIEKGSITLGAGEYRREVYGAGDVRFKQSSDYVDVFGGALGSGEVWARLQMTCPSTGSVAFDSGEVRREDAICKQDKRLLFMFEGRARRGAHDSCCPADVKCPR